MGGYAGHIKHIYEANASVSDIVYLLDNIVWGNKALRHAPQTRNRF